MGPRRRLGQHFLLDANIARKIARAVDLPPPRWILEIGPGTGMLTQFLLEQADQYVGVELDPTLVAHLQATFGSLPRVTFRQEDILETNLGTLLQAASRYHRAVVGNLPYYITSPILFRLFEWHRQLELAVLMIQKEVAERMVAAPGGKAYGLLSIYSQLFASVELLFRVPPHCFRPPPQVESAVIRLRFRPHALEPIKDYSLLQKLLRVAFQKRRKMLKNSLGVLFPVEVLDKLPINLRARPEEVSLTQWIDLANRLSEIKDVTRTNESHSTGKRSGTHSG